MGLMGLMGPIGCAARAALGASVKVGLNGGKWCEMQVLGAIGVYFCDVLRSAARLQGAYLWHALSICIYDPGTTL